MLKPSQVVDSLLTVLAGLLAMVIVGTTLASIQGCTSFTKPDNETRVTEYGGEGSYMMQASGQVAGCRAVQTGTIKGCLEFTGKTCSFKSEACK